VRLADKIPGRANFYLVDFGGPSLIRVCNDSGENERMITVGEWMAQLPPWPPDFWAELRKLWQVDLERIRAAEKAQ
jgi:hypothetical protein